MAFTAEYSEKEPTRGELDAMAGPVVVEFGAPWCGHCLAIQADLEGILSSHPDVQHIKIYDGRGKPLGRSFRVKLWPTLVFLRNGNLIARLVRPENAEIDEAMRLLAAT